MILAHSGSNAQLQKLQSQNDKYKVEKNRKK